MNDQLLSYLFTQSPLGAVAGMEWVRGGGDGD